MLIAATSTNYFNSDMIGIVKEISDLYQMQNQEMSNQKMTIMKMVKLH